MALLNNKQESDCSERLVGLSIAGKLGSVVTAIKPRQAGRVKVAGSYWPARCSIESVIESGNRVVVVERKKMTLWVQPLE
jgi:membrane protein implicated in regulation of membrane protease activity